MEVKSNAKTGAIYKCFVFLVIKLKNMSGDDCSL